MMVSRPRALALAAVGAAVAVALAACGSSASSGDSTTASSGGTYKIFAVEPLSGESATYGQAETAALRAGVAIVNAAGGFDGRKGVLTVKDDQGDPAQAVSLLQQQISSGNIPNLLIPGASSNETLALLPAAAQAKILVLTNQTADQINDPAKYPYTFNDTYTAHDAEGALVQYLAQKGLPCRFRGWLRKGGEAQMACRAVGLAC